ncbi:hypothetical protein FZEAL_4603 [Fusarium zealandicum]|uniref:DUF3669 domain-containing protein n=1 Tax=Fusarium zealandicum TaxID=1053134 RepID=A0A8H4XKM7_9HYPO|nr:hypothetical protein FZEAL_4603 [Fusarium zealandicum]
MSSTGETTTEENVANICATRYALGQRDGMYYISIKPAEPARLPSWSVADLLGPLEGSCFADRVNKCLLWSPMPKPDTDAKEYQLTKLVSTLRAKIYTTQFGSRTYVAKLGNNPNPNDVANELQCHEQVYERMRELWGRATPDLWDPTPRRISIPSPHSKIVIRTRSGLTSVFGGFTMDYIPPLHPHHARGLVHIWISPGLQDLVLKNPNMSQVRLEIRMGELSPYGEPKSTRVVSRPAYINQLWHEAGESVFEWANTMGVTLAILHWGCNLDARGVKFLLGTKRDSVHLWMTGFDDCEHFDKATCTSQSLVSAMIGNPAWPRPVFGVSVDPENDPDGVVASTWDAFSKSYLVASKSLLSGEDQASGNTRHPSLFLCKLESTWRLRAERAQRGMLASNLLWPRSRLSREIWMTETPVGQPDAEG